MLEIDPNFIWHLNVIPEVWPINQWGRRSAVEHVDVVIEEVNKLSKVDAIREVLYSSCPSNTVVVKNQNGKWQVCVGFTSLNWACSKGCFSLPKIDQLVDFTSGHGRISFLDAYWGYHQITMHEPNEEKTIFITPTTYFATGSCLFEWKISTKKERKW